MLEEIKNIKSGKRELRQFGIVLGIALGLFAALFFIREKHYYSYFVILSMAFLFLGLALPIALKPIQKIWMSLGIFIGWLLTRLILIILFYFVVTPIGILARIFGEDSLDTRLDKNTDSYWIAKPTVKFNKESYEHQF